MLRVAVLALLLLGSAGCGGDESPGAEGVDGHNVRADDTGRDDTADGGGWLLVVPAERAPELWAAVDVDEPDDLRHAQFTVDRKTARAAGGSLVLVDDDGDYTVDRAGRTLLCRVPPRGSAYGCAVVDLPVTGEVVTSFGEGGFTARVRG